MKLDETTVGIMEILDRRNMETVRTFPEIERIKAGAAYMERESHRDKRRMAKREEVLHGCIRAVKWTSLVLAVWLLGMNEVYNKPTLLLAVACGIAAWVMAMAQVHKERETVKYIPLPKGRERRRSV